MAILLPNLDDRRWRDLVDEGRALIPLYAPEWTDHNVHDPGITLMELFAWVAEMDIYQLNRISDAAKLKFLRLVDVSPNGPVAATTVLRFWVAEQAAGATTVEPIDLPANIECAALDPAGVQTIVRTLGPLTILPSSLAALQVKDARGFHDMTDRWRRGVPFGAFGDVPAQGAELYFGFDRPLLADQRLSLFAAFTNPHASADERHRLLDEQRAQQAACVPQVIACPCGCYPCGCQGHEAPSPRESAQDEPPYDQPSALPSASSRLTWEVLAPVPVASAVASAGASASFRWIAIPPTGVEDDTRALTLNGGIRLTLPVDVGRTRLGQVATRLYYLRLRYEAGAYDAVPIIATLDGNAVLAEQAYSLEDMSLGHGNGMPLQRFVLPDGPVLTEGVAIRTVEHGTRYPWRMRLDLDASRASDRDVVLDAMSGTLAFGDGEHGMAVALEAEVVVSASATRAAAGYLRAGTPFTLLDSPHNRKRIADLSQAQAAIHIKSVTDLTGGKTAESLDDAIARAIAIIDHADRAVTRADFETLARETPGFDIARATAWAGVHPNFPCVEASGVVTVVVIPNMPVPKPTPSVTLLRAVASYLNRRRLLGTRIAVVAPTYREVAVRAVVQALPNTNATVLEQRVIDALDAFLHPLTGGPDGTGWPFGRDVFRADMLEVIHRVPGVDFVVSLALIADGCTCDPQCGNVCVAPTWLATPGQHAITVQ